MADPLQKLIEAGTIVSRLAQAPDDALITDAECEALTRLDRSTIWRIEHGLDRDGERRFFPEPLLKSHKLGAKRKVRKLGDVRAYIRKCTKS